MPYPDCMYKAREHTVKNRITGNVNNKLEAHEDIRLI